MTHRRILFIAPQIPYPLDVGLRIRMFHVLSAYAGIGKVNLAFFYRNEEELAGMEALKPYCEAFHPVSSRTWYEKTFFELAPWRRRLMGLGSRLPLSFRILYSSEMAKVVETLASSCEIIHISRLQMMPYIELLRTQNPGEPRLILDLDDIETVSKKRELEINPPIGWRSKLFEYVDLIRLGRYQKKALRKVDQLWVCSEKDRAYFHNHPKVLVVPNGASFPKERLPDESDGKTLLYIGTLSYAPNLDGLLFFVKEIFPLIQKRVAGCRLMIVGRNPPPALSRLNDGRAILVEENVPSVEKYYRQSTVSVVPLRSGGGTRLKILESFALGRPVVSTSIGCEGLRVENGKQLLVSDDPAGFATACVDLLQNPGRRETLVAQARSLVEQHYRWESIQTLVQNLCGEFFEKKFPGKARLDRPTVRNQ